MSDLILGGAESSEGILGGLLEQLPGHEQKKILFGVLKYAVETYFTTFSDSTAVDANTVSAVAGLIKRVTDSSAVLHEQLVSWLLTNLAVGLMNSISIRRAVVAIVAENPKTLTEILEKSISEFGDQLFIKHAPIIQQEGTYLLSLFRGPVLDDTTTDKLYSQGTSNTSLRRVRQPRVAKGTHISITVADISRNGVESTGRLAKPSQISWYGSRRGAIRPDRRQQEEARLSHGRDEIGGGHVVQGACPGF